MSAMRSTARWDRAFARAAVLDALHATAGRLQVLDAIADVLTNIVGAEELAIFEVDRGGAHLNLLAGVGIEDLRPLEEIGFGEGAVGRVAASGRLFIDHGDAQAALVPWEETLTACIPLKQDSRLTGVIAIFGLSLEKFEFDAIDLEIFDLLTTHAGAALCAPERREEYC